MFTLERLPDSEKGPRRAYGLAGRLDDLFDGSAKEMREAGRDEIEAEALALPLADWGDPEVVWDR